MLRYFKACTRPNHGEVNYTNADGPISRVVIGQEVDYRS